MTTAALGIEAIDALLEREHLVRGNCDVPYPCGAFGWLSYDIARELEDVPATTTPDGLPHLQLGVFDRVATWKEPHDGEVRLRVTACPLVDGAPGAAYEEGRERALALADAALRGERHVPSLPSTDRSATFESECGEAAFTDRVRTVKRYVRDGDTFQTNISQRLVAPAAVHPVGTFDAVRRVNPAPYSGLMEFPNVDRSSVRQPRTAARMSTATDASPNPSRERDPRGDTHDEDVQFEADLRTDEKERAEHAMLVDLERNDLGKVSEYGTVDVRSTAASTATRR